jgi:hypothetical protein
MFGGDNDEKVTIDTAGVATFDGRITIGTGSNWVRNSDCRVNTSSWSLFTNSAIAATLNGPWPASSGTWNLGGVDNDCWLFVPGAPSVSSVSSMYGGGTTANNLFPVKGLSFYEASAYMGVHVGGTAYTFIQWFDYAETLITQSATGASCTTANNGGPSLSSTTIPTSGYCRSGIIAQAPSNAAYARMVIQWEHTTTANPVLFLAHMYFGEATVGQEDLTEWSPAGVTSINNGLIETDSINARAIAADSITTSELAADSVTSAKIVSGTIVASDIAAGTITANEIAADTITASQIAGGTITGGEIAGGTITADKLNVSTLSAITADLGTVTAGSLTAVNITGSSSINIQSGKFEVEGATGLVRYDELRPQPGETGYVEALFYRNNTWSGGGVRIVCHDNTGLLIPEGEGGCTNPPSPLVAAELKEKDARISALERDVAELRAMLAALLAVQR